MKVVVTGGSGFIGTSTVLAAKRAGHDVVNIDIKPGLPDVATHLVDIRDAAEVLEVFQAERPDAVIHLAAQISVPSSVKAPQFDASVNVIGSLSVFEAARQCGIKKVVFSSTAAVYGDEAVPPIAESTHLRPHSPYGLSKLACEQYLQRFYGQFFDSVIFRYGNAYGLLQDPGTGAVIANFARRALSEGRVTVYGDGGQLRDFIHVTDVADANVAALDYDGSLVVNLGTGVPVSIRGIIDTLGTVLGREIAVDYEPPRAGDIYASYYDATRITEEMKWKASVTLEAGIRGLIEQLTAQAATS